MSHSDILGLPEPVLRFGAFAAVFVAMALIELAWPKRDLSAPKGRRWLTNLAIVGIDSLVVRLMAQLTVPLVAIGAAIYAEVHGIGLFNRLAQPMWTEILIAVVILDLAIWFQHWAAHRFPVLWRLHQMHHADVDIDVTTAIRFHPIEIALSMLWKIACVLALGISPIAVLLFEIILNACAMFNHANIALPRGLDRIIRLVIVTPDMHRIHHSVLGREHNSNYGFNLSIWDRLFGTYTDQPAAGHTGMTIGLPAYQTEGPTRLGWSLTLPFRHQPPAE
ncbi:MAG: fatty acid hydroxylase [Hyphomicrobium sp.]|nr:MAG: fatty acid hydroxylase [Hyphomicrobium sp.]